MFQTTRKATACLFAEFLGMGHRDSSRCILSPYEGWEDSLLRNARADHDPFLFYTTPISPSARPRARCPFGVWGDDILTGKLWPYLTFLFRRRLGTIVKTFDGIS